MPTDSLPLVRIEMPRKSLASTMVGMRTWLDSYRVRPAVFKIAPTETGVVFDIQFLDEDHAKLFEQAFA
jgi:hypothetical protein